MRSSEENCLLRTDSGSLLVEVKGAGEYELEMREEENLGVLRPVRPKSTLADQIESIWIDDETLLFNNFIHDLRSNFSSQTKTSNSQQWLIQGFGADTNKTGIEPFVSPCKETGFPETEEPKTDNRPILKEISKRDPKGFEDLEGFDILLQPNEDQLKIEAHEPSSANEKFLRNPLENPKVGLSESSFQVQNFALQNGQNFSPELYSNFMEVEKTFNEPPQPIRLVKANKSDLFEQRTHLKKQLSELTLQQSLHPSVSTVDDNDVFSVLFNHRRVHQCYLTENDSRLISFCCSFNDVIPSNLKPQFLQQITCFIDSEWGRVLLFKICNLQPKTIKKNEQFEKKVFKFIFRNLNSDCKKRILSLSDLRPRTDPQKTTVPEKKLQRKIKKERTTGNRSLEGSQEGGEEKNTPKEVAYNSRTYRKIGNDPELRDLFLSKLEKLKKEVLFRLYSDLLSEIGSAIRFFEAEKLNLSNLGTKEIEKLKLNALQQYYQIWERPNRGCAKDNQIDLQQQSEQNKLRTLKLPWTYSMFFHAVLKFERTFSYQFTEYEEQPKAMRMSEAIDCAVRQKLLGFSQEALLRRIAVERSVPVQGQPGSFNPVSNKNQEPDS